MEVFGNRMFELRNKPQFLWLVRASSIAVHEAEQRRKQVDEGSLLFGYFFLATQEKVARQPGETGKGQSNNLH